MKRILLFLMMIFTVISMSAEIWYFKTTAFCSNVFNYSTKTWSGWTSWESSNLLITMDTKTDIIRIYSTQMQTYKITAQAEKGYDEDGEFRVIFKFVDNEGDLGRMILYTRDNGDSEIYVIFSNVRWGYKVVRTQ